MKTHIYITQVNENTYLYHSSLMKFLKKGLTFPIGSLLLIFALFQTCCSRTLIFVGTYFDQIFWSRRKLIFVNNSHFKRTYKKKPKNREHL